MFATAACLIPKEVGSLPHGCDLPQLNVGDLSLIPLSAYRRFVDIWSVVDLWIQTEPLPASFDLEENTQTRSCFSVW